MAPINEVYQFKITLQDSKPAIWRRILVPCNFTFRKFHYAIQSCMNWDNSHLHSFEILHLTSNSKVEIGKPTYDDCMLNEAKERISNYFTKQNSKAKYIYDFGDNWVHIIKFEKIIPAVKDETYPKCIAGEMAAPPEDSGGTYGFYYKLAVLNDPENDDYEDIIEWMGDEFDPTSFDPDEVVFYKLR